MTKKEDWQQVGQGIQNTSKVIPSVLESLGRGAIAQVPGTVGDISSTLRQFAPDTMQSVFGNRQAPTTEEILQAVPRINPDYQGSSQHEMIGSVTAPALAKMLKMGAEASKGMQGGLMLVGPNSKSWDKQMLVLAEKMEKEGKSPEEIWKATGTGRGLDNAFRQEISDNNAILKGTGNFGQIFEHRKAMHGVTTPIVEEILRHPELLESYPQLKNVQVNLLPETSRNKASYSPTQGIINIHPKLTSEQAISSMLHELQHGIQETEGWNKGADAGLFLKKYQDQADNIEQRLIEANKAASKAVGTPEYDQLMSIRDEIGKEYRDFIGPKHTGVYDKAIQEYKAHGGEAEARLTQTRQKLTKEERKNIYPFIKGDKALDINPEDAIIKMKHDSPTITRKDILKKELNKL
jgi:hypothetical protein